MPLSDETHNNMKLIQEREEELEEALIGVVTEDVVDLIVMVAYKNGDTSTMVSNDLHYPEELAQSLAEIYIQVQTDGAKVH
jgi:hypothetical protein|tara:strand:+ start:957 stop:1199 length:243 start_codon:yes stop_codon:yes gene_type:complete